MNHKQQIKNRSNSTISNSPFSTLNSPFLPPLRMSPAPTRNQLWKLRPKHSREQLFANPDLLWKAACSYFEWCDSHPWLKPAPLRSGAAAGTTMDVPSPRPYTISGLCFYLGCSKAFWQQVKTGSDYQAFTDTIDRIEHVIEAQQLEGAALGLFSTTIVTRSLSQREQADSATSAASEPTTKIVVEVVTRDSLSV